LYILGIKESAILLQELAEQGDPFAIDALGGIPGSEEVLAKLSRTPNINIRLNAILSLLKLKDKRCLSGLFEILITDPRDLAFAEISTPGRGLKAWKAIPSANHQGDEAAALLELSLQFKETVLTLALELEEEYFLFLANKLFESKQNDLVPILVHLLANLDTEDSIALLKNVQQKAGAPLIRAYATLGLVKLKEEGPYSEQLKEWVISGQNLDIMKFRTFVPFDMRDVASTYELTPQETSKFLIEAIQILAETQEQDSINLLLQLLKDGHPRNRPVIAGLLLRVAN
jgi:HEAT repeat protein